MLTKENSSVINYNDRKWYLTMSGDGWIGRHITPADKTVTSTDKPGIQESKGEVFLFFVIIIWVHICT